MMDVEMDWNWLGRVFAIPRRVRNLETRRVRLPVRRVGAKKKKYSATVVPHEFRTADSALLSRLPDP
jgi:hypothetical protein